MTLQHSLVGWLPSPLLEPRRVWLAIATGWVCTFFPSLVLSWAAAQLFPNAAGPEFNISGAMAVFLLVVFAPVTETFIMAGVLELLLRFVRPPVAILLSAVGWGLAHSYAAPAWGLVIWWPFLIFSTLFVVWRQRGFLTGVGVAAATHAMQNLAPALLLAFGN